MSKFTRWHLLQALLAGPTWVTLLDGSTREAVGATRTCVILRNNEVAPFALVTRIETLEVTGCVATV